MEDESGVTRCIIDEIDSLKVKVVLPKVALMNFNLRISKEIKFKVKVLFLEVS